MEFKSNNNNTCTFLFEHYRKFPKYSDTKTFVVITLKFELCDSTIE